MRPIAGTLVAVLFLVGLVRAQQSAGSLANPAKAQIHLEQFLIAKCQHGIPLWLLDVRVFHGRQLYA